MSSPILADKAFVRATITNKTIDRAPWYIKPETNPTGRPSTSWRPLGAVTSSHFDRFGQNDYTANYTELIGSLGVPWAIVGTRGSFFIGMPFTAALTLSDTSFAIVGMVRPL